VAGTCSYSGYDTISDYGSYALPSENTTGSIETYIEPVWVYEVKVVQTGRVYDYSDGALDFLMPMAHGINDSYMQDWTKEELIIECTSDNTISMLYQNAMSLSSTDITNLFRQGTWFLGWLKEAYRPNAEYSASNAYSKLKVHTCGLISLEFHKDVYEDLPTTLDINLSVNYSV
jgi:hypothetical protein